MEKFNHLPKTEGCLAEGSPIDPWVCQAERPLRSVPRDTAKGKEERFCERERCFMGRYDSDLRPARLKGEHDEQGAIPPIRAEGTCRRANFGPTGPA